MKLQWIKPNFPQNYSRIAKIHREMQILPWEEEEEEAYPKSNAVSSLGAYPCSCAETLWSSESPFSLSSSPISLSLATKTTRLFIWDLDPQIFHRFFKSNQTNPIQHDFFFLFFFRKIRNLERNSKFWGGFGIIFFQFFFLVRQNSKK